MIRALWDYWIFLIECKEDTYKSAVSTLAKRSNAYSAEVTRLEAELARLKDSNGHLANKLAHCQIDRDFAKLRVK
jgi:prefoldin subunit 5